MDRESLTSPTRVKQLLDRLEVRASKVLGQNFLIDRNVLNILVDAAELNAGDGVLEIGAGLGVVSREIAARCGRLLAVEKDPRLCAYLDQTVGKRPNVRVACRDALELDHADLVSRGYVKMVGNLPYSVGSRIVMDAAMCAEPVELAVVTVQKEVAERMSAPTGGKAFGLLSLWIQMAFHVEPIKTVSSTCFRPRPGVVSEIVRLRRRRPLLSAEKSDRMLFFGLTRFLFMHRRKQLASLLAQALCAPAHGPDGWRAALEARGLAPRSRPEDLPPAAWAELMSGPLRGGELEPSLRNRKHEASAKTA